MPPARRQPIYRESPVIDRWRRQWSELILRDLSRSSVRPTTIFPSRRAFKFMRDHELFLGTLVARVPSPPG
jgi:hypothetical protein